MQLLYLVNGKDKTISRGSDIPQQQNLASTCKPEYAEKTFIFVNTRPYEQNTMISVTYPELLANGN